MLAPKLRVFVVYVYNITMFEINARTKNVRFMEEPKRI
tara:strand:+ start:690 stop:803 length:114 start_codon:yes stop_codon:yes gene_type:complete